MFQEQLLLLGSNYAIVISNDKGYDVVISELNQTKRKTYYA